MPDFLDYNMRKMLTKNKDWSNNLNEVIPLCIYIFTLLLYIAVNTTIIEYNTNATCFDLQ